ncbi:putative serine esterase-domain-containing protein [Apodospora peruviana]|uniref:Serine esterase-domain-containing protein n=1 Tax=Apodospora peruviana TaxID=516989 RepID=A0AAE0IIU0_9PEZI|nr:putative serine esterase-domain-containing protein [Apodospora peruviana]
MDPLAECGGGSIEADHLCVLVHGLWGNPNHMASVARTLRAQHPRDKLYILVAKRNSGSFTYDGVELGGERVCHEIEEELKAIADKGGKIKKLSVVGYSLGGLVGRYAIGLLYARGVLDGLECMNFTAFASPFLGVRSPRRGWWSRVFNGMGPRTLSRSGQQLFGVDKFRDTGKPLVAVMADPKSIFMSGLARFKRHTLYANITNDKTAVYYTTSISKTDPFTDLDNIKVNFVKGYDDVILDPVNPIAEMPNQDATGVNPPQPVPVTAAMKKQLRQMGFSLALTVLVPIGVVAYLTNAVIQTVRSSWRVKLHERGLAGIDIETFRRVNLWKINEIREAVEDAYEEMNNSQDQDYLASSSTSSDSDSLSRQRGKKIPNGGVVGDESDDDDDDDPTMILALERKQSRPSEPTLALAPYQFEAIKTLDSLNWRKYRVWIHNDNHTHAAIVVRMEKPSFDEGKVVLNHWVKDEFLC